MLVVYHNRGKWSNTDGIIVSRHLAASSVKSDNFKTGTGILSATLPTVALGSNLAVFNEIAAVPIPSTPAAHKYLLVLALEISNGSGGGYAEYGVRVKKSSDSSIIAENYTDAAAGYWFITIALTGVFTSSGGESVSITASANATGRAIGSRSRYSIIDLGVA